MKKKLTKIVVFIISMIWLCLVLAEPESETVESSEKAAEQSKQQTPDKTATNKKPLKEFVPSEEISIDKPVAFPVDI